MWLVWRDDIGCDGGQAAAVSSPRRGYPSDLTDAQWALIEPLLPEPATEGRREKHPQREVVNAILYVVRSGCPWGYLPADHSPWQTVYWYFTRWEQAGVTEAPLAVLRVKARAVQDRGPEPSAGIIDSQSVKGADTVGRDTRGYDAGKKVNGRKRFIVADTLGLLVTVWGSRGVVAGPRRSQGRAGRCEPGGTGDAALFADSGFPTGLPPRGGTITVSMAADHE